MCRSDEIDAVFVATPTGMHAEHAICALRAGKHVIVEKPMASTVAQAELMAVTAVECGRALVVGHSHSFEPAIQLMRAAVASGRFGALRAVNAWNYTDWVYRPRLPAELRREQGGGVVFRQAVHHADIARFLAGGSPRSVRAKVGSWDSKRETDGSYSAFLNFGNDLSATLFYSGYDHFPSTELTFGVGENGKPARGDYAHARREAERTASDEAATKHSSGLDLQMDRLAPGTHPAFFGILVLSCELADMRIAQEGVLVYTDSARYTVPIAGMPVGRTALLDELIDAAEGLVTTHDGLWGRENLELCCAILESSSCDMEVNLTSPRVNAVSISPAAKTHFEAHWPCL
jgi:phthalate 4,5-cis-dihydrodiol dehydrogenase